VEKGGSSRNINRFEKRRINHGEQIDGQLGIRRERVTVAIDAITVKPQKTKAPTNNRDTDLVAAIVRRLDGHFFNLEAARHAFTGDEICIPGEDRRAGSANLLYTPRMRAAVAVSSRIGDKLREVLPKDKWHLLLDQSEADAEYVCASDSVARLFGFIMGLRVAGLNSAEANKIARVWGIHSY